MLNQFIYLHYNEGFPAIPSENISIIEYHKHTQNALKDLLTPSEGIIISKDSTSENLDSKIISDIRHKFHLKQPILVISDENIDSWFEVDSSEFPEYLRYLQDPSVSYLTGKEFQQLSGKEIRNCFEEELDDILLNEVCSYLYDDFGYMINRLLELKSNIIKEKNENHLQLILNRYFPELKIILHRKLNVSDRGDEYLNQILTLIQEFDEKSYDDIIQYINRIIKGLEDYAHFLLQEERRYETREKGEVVFIGNSRDTIRQIEDHFFSQGVICRGTSCPNEVIELLKNDKSNKITVVICESRFYSESKKIKRRQLRHLNEMISNLPNIISRIVLTDSDTSFIQNSIISDICIHKNLIMHHPYGMQRLSNAFFALDKEVRNTINNFPGFNDQQKLLYKKHKASADYLKVEREISIKAETIVKTLAEGNSAVELGLPALNGKLKNKNPMRNLENFRNILLARRIAIGLCQLDEKTLKSNYPTINKSLINIERWGIIYHSLKNGSLKLLGNDLPDEAEISTVINRNLKLSIKNRYKAISGLQGRVTIEERTWLDNIITTSTFQVNENSNGKKLNGSPFLQVLQ